VLERVLRAAMPAGYVALAVLVLSGEAIRWVDYRDTLISAPLLRAVHVLAGFALLASLLLRLGDAALRDVQRLRAGRLRLRLPPAHAPVTAAGLLDAAWWLVVGLLLLSGVERYAQLRYGAGLLPGLPSAAWWALHRPLLGYLYAILLLLLAIRGKLIARRVYAYLYRP
jgi:hypothetical protein